jgi:hypothetical protein
LGRFLGYGSDPSDWSATEITEVADHIASGLRRFYGTYQWSFLSPSYSFATVASQADYDLPYNFLDPLDRLTLSTSNGAPWTVPFVPHATIRHYRQMDNSVGQPRMAAIIPTTSDGTTGTRYTLTLYPTPEAVVTASFRMSLQADTIDADHPYPLGGTQHAETILECCLAAAESTMDDTQAVHDTRAKELLAQSVRMDRSLTPVFTLGYNGDNSSDYDHKPIDRRRSVTLTIT